MGAGITQHPWKTWCRAKGTVPLNSRFRGQTQHQGRGRGDASCLPPIQGLWRLVQPPAQAGAALSTTVTMAPCGCSELLGHTPAPAQTPLGPYPPGPLQRQSAALSISSGHGVGVLCAIRQGSIIPTLRPLFAATAPG
ncbi:hypothetical protein KIL84_021094 [Mauremys mutica]|uniref:Uncharacterized protein n=1 Tax=Mauremys mutica TaxID=74926 RepID=A0A9D3XC68_9SAUR|nr:hypothetical protein KIL84_021094 [Mauremys mutica]